LLIFVGICSERGGQRAACVGGWQVTGDNPANASFDMEFRLFSAAAGGAQIGPLLTRLNVPAIDGLFNVQLDFGPAQFAGDRQWLEVRSKPSGGGSYETLSTAPRRRRASRWFPRSAERLVAVLKDRAD
jgi:hypothetical protein